ncbi:hypothetical protein WJX72_010388 [[Myrmecia] bisecta]|uniref:Dipeptidyl peptidase 3 n=1 Tax=[Myrmecia] bisecta TaxID=41462 RepID=A0AAW1Q1K8_9CHLO
MVHATAGIDTIRQQHQVAVDTPVRRLEVQAAWSDLTAQEKAYAHHFAKASWAGARACLQQVSEESPAIFQLLQMLFRAPAGNQQQHFLQQYAEAATAAASEADWRAFLAYAATFYGNLGNYLSFGDSKIVPAVPRESLAKIVAARPATSDADKARIQAIWERVGPKMYSLGAGERELGFAPNGSSAYYSPGISKDEAELVGRYMKSAGVLAENTRVFKTASSPPTYELRIASASSSRADAVEFEGAQIVVVHGDFSEEMAVVAAELQQAQQHAANDTQRRMVAEYVRHFQGGDVEAHKASQRLWIADRGPVVETNIGFIETYRDPLGVRAEFEGLVAVVNKEMSAKFTALVDSAPRLLKTLPWPAEFEKDTFQRPDFTSLEVLAFAGTGVPAGINIPNYDDIRQSEGFKNVSLGNVLAAPEGQEPITFIPEQQQQQFRKLKGPAFELQVGAHELLGHGSGKLLSEDTRGKFNFDKGHLLNPFTGEPISSWYRPGETWDSTFGSISGAYEECRAECTGIFMSANPEVLAIFGHSGEAADEIMYTNWLIMARAGLCALEFYTPETKTWRQAHMQARYAILRVLLEASAKDESPGPRLLEIRPTTSKDASGQDAANLEVHLDKSKIRTVGMSAIGEFLGRLNIYKAMADVQTGGSMFRDKTSVDADWEAKRAIVLRQKRPRPLFVQPHTEMDTDGRVVVVEFEASHEGLITSFVTRYGATERLNP